MLNKVILIGRLTRDPELRQTQGGTAGYPVVFHIHDEVVTDIEKERADLDAVVGVMSQPIP